MKDRLLVTILTFILAGTTSISVYAIQKSREQREWIKTIDTSNFSQSVIDNEKISLLSPNEQNFGLSKNDIKLGGWIPNFDFVSGLQSVHANADSYATIHYAGAAVGENGEVSFGTDFDTRMNELNKLAIPIGLNVISSNYTGSRNFLNTPHWQEQFKQRIASTKQKYSSFKSLNINFEKVDQNQKDSYLNYLRSIKSYTLTQGMLLTVTVYPDLNGTSVHEYGFLGEIADTVIIMAYDYPYRGEKINGNFVSNAPLEWIERIIEHALKHIPTEKLAIGLPLYGYGFHKNSATIKTTTSYTYEQIESIMLKENLTSHYDTQHHEMYIERANERIYFQNNDTLAQRIDLIAQKGIYQVFYWRLGRDRNIGIM